MKRAIYISLVALFGVMFIAQSVLMLNPWWWRLGFVREVWHTPANVGFHSNWGAVVGGDLVFLFWENEQHPVSANGMTWFPREVRRLESAGSPPQSTVASTATVRSLRLWRVAAYRYSIATGGAWQGQYHLVIVNPLTVLGGCLVLGGVFFVMAWRTREKHVGGFEVGKVNATGR